MTSRKSQSGFTLVEVLISMGILVSLVIAVAQMMQSSFDVRENLSLEYRTSHGFRIGMRKVIHDLQHAYIIATDDVRHVESAKKQTIFLLEKGSLDDTLRMTFRAHSPIRKNEPESDVSYVVYQVKEVEGKRHLFRGVSGRIPDVFGDLEEMEILVKDIISFRIEPHNGDGWHRDRWDSQNRDTRNKLPQMVRVILEAYDFEENVEKERLRRRRFASIVRLGYALDSETLKERATSFRL